MAESWDAIVVGAGPNGLAAGIELARSGYRVKIFEAMHEPGGGTHTKELTLPGFRHDQCSAVHPMGILSPYFRQLPLADFGLTWLTTEASVAHPLDEGYAVMLYQSLDRTADQLTRKDADRWRSLFSPFLEHPHDLLSDLMGPLGRMPKRPLAMARFGLQALWPARKLARRLFDNQRAQALFAGCAGHSVLSLDHWMTSALGLIFALTSHVETWPVAKGGSGAIGRALADYFLSLGGEIECNQRIASLAELPDARVVLFDLSPKAVAEIAADALPNHYRRRLLRYRYGPGTFKLDWALDGAITAQGGGLPQAALRLARRPGGGFGGQLFVNPYAAGDARLALDTVRFTADAGGATRFQTAMRLDGPLPDGRLRGLSLPVEGRIAANGAVMINPDCVPLSLLEARYGSFALGQTRQTLCPADNGAMFAMGPAGMTGGVQVKDVDLTGRSGDSPLHLTADHARMLLGHPGFTLANPAVTIGPQDAPVRLTAATLDGAMTADGLAGKIGGAGGQIGTVPLIVEQGAGDWRFADGALSLKAAMTVRDSQASARFNSLNVPDFALSLKDGRIAATGTLTAPRNGATVATTDIVHDLGDGKGHADLDVANLAFNNALQPEDVTPLALGVVANVQARVSGQGRIDWTGSTVTSTGTFRTQDANLAAAFGPVEGLAGEIHFTDLIGLVTAPGQEVRMRSVNPGVEARDGVVRYRLEAGQKVRIEGGGWPFSGGQLVLLPTTMDFSADVDRYLTFRVVGLDAGAFIQAMELDNISATGTFDGIMPLIFNGQGGRVAGGVLVARQAGMEPLLMPEGVLPTIPCDSTRQGGTLSYVGPVSNEDIGVMGKVAFDALKNLQYKCLTILMDGALDGEMVTNVVFNGVNRDRLGGVPAGLARNFTGLPFIFNVRIAAPFRGLLGTAQSFIDPSSLIQSEIAKEAQEKMRAQDQQRLAVQPLESDKVSNGEPQ